MRKRISWLTAVLLVGVLVSAVYCIFIPYGAGFDEETHLVRIWDIANLNFSPNHSQNGVTVTVKDFLSRSYQRRDFQSPATDMFTSDSLAKPVDVQQALGVQTRSIYSPAIFLPEAIVAKIAWRVLALPMLPGVLLMRWAGLLVYFLGVYFTLRWLPMGKWVFLILALAPMALFQTSTLSADGFTSAACFLFIGLTLKTAVEPVETPIGTGRVLALAGLCLLIGLAKPGYFLLFGLLFLLPRRRFTAKTLLVLWVGILAGIAITFGWMILSTPKSHFGEGGSQDLGRQLRLIMENPFNFLLTYFRGIFASAGNYFKDWVGVYGYWVGEVPVGVYIAYPIALIAAVLAEPRQKIFTGRTRLWMAVVSLLATAAIIFLYFYLHYSPDVTDTVGRQGRYFTPTLPLLFLAISGWLAMPHKASLALRWVAIGALGVTVGLYSLGLYASYYTECGYSTFAGRSCQLPIYKNLEKGDAPEVKVNAASAVSQSFVSHCGAVESVSVLIKSLPAGSSGTIRFTVVDGAEKEVARQDVPLSALPVGEYAGLTFPKPAGEVGSLFTVQLSAADLPASESIGVGIRPVRKYSEGHLRVAGEIIGSDLIFHYNCPNPGLGK